MTAPALYLTFPGVAADALRFYQDTFGGELTLHTFEAFGRTDGPTSAIAHGTLAGPVDLFAADAAGGEPTVQMSGVRVALLGAADGPTLTRWFHKLSVEGEVLDPLQKRSWGATDGQVVDRYGLRWLIGFEDEA